MTTHTTDFNRSGYTLSAQPYDWTVEWSADTLTWLLSSAGTDNYLWASSAVSPQHFAISWDAVGTPADVDIIAEAIYYDSADGEYIRLIARGSGADTTEAGYVAVVYWESATAKIKIASYVAGVESVVASANYSHADSINYWVRFQLSGTALKLKIWPKTDPTEPAGWNIETTDSDHASGWVGVGGYHLEGSPEFYYISVGVAGAEPYWYPPVAQWTFSYPVPYEFYLPTRHLNFTAEIPAPPIVRPRGNPISIYRARIDITGGNSHTIAITNWQSTWRYSLSTFLSVNIHAPDSSAIDDILAALTADPVVAVSMTLQAGWRWPSGAADFWQDQMTVAVSNLRTDEGGRNKSMRLDGYRPAASDTPKLYSIGSGEYIRAGLGATGWRGNVDANVRPGDKVTLADTGTDIVIGSVTYIVNANRATMEISELVDADLLAQLPW